MQLTEIKTAVFAQIATSTTAQVKAWVEQHNLDVDLRTKEGWLTVLNAIAQLAKSAAQAINEADIVAINEAVCNEASAIATDLKRFWTPALRFGWHCLRLTAIGFAIAAIYCLRTGQRFRAFVSQFENKGMAPHHIAWYFAKPVLHRVRAIVARRWALVKERAIALSAQRRVREAAVGAVGGFVMFTGVGLIG